MKSIILAALISLPLYFVSFGFAFSGSIFRVFSPCLLLFVLGVVVCKMASKTNQLISGFHVIVGVFIPSIFITIALLAQRISLNSLYWLLIGVVFSISFKIGDIVGKRYFR